MRYVRTASFAGLLLFCSGAFAQSPTLSIANYQFVSDQVITATQSRVTYRADLVNSGPALAHVTATVISIDPFTVRVIPGAGTLNFDNVPANGKATSSDTFTILVTTGAALNASALQWTFETSGGPVANAGSNQTAAIGSTVTLNGSGSTNPSGAGTLTYHWAFTSLPQGSNTFLANSFYPFSTFVVDKAGTYVIALTVSNGVESSTASVTVSTSQTAPVAKAGPNQTVPVGSTAVLNGSASTSADGRTLTYSWTLITRPSGSTASLSGASTVAPTFFVDLPGTYVAQLVVNDGMASTPATVTITTQAVAPTANAGPNQSVNAGALVQLNGAGSTDPGGHALTYQWALLSMPSGSTAALSNATAVNPTFTADKGGTYVVQLVVSNGALASTPATVTITTQAQLAPTANAGPNQTVNLGSTVTLNGSGTDPQSLPLTFQWTLISKPALSMAGLSGANGQHPTFFADVAGSYVAQLIVNNGALNSAPSTVTISTSCAQPTANAGPSQNVTTGATVTLSGSGSGGACQGALTYAWSLTIRPGGSAATLSGSSTVSPTFLADVAGTYVAQLIVNNGVMGSNPATVTITASGGTGPGGGTPGANPGLNLPANVTVAPGQTVQYALTVGSPAPDWLFVTLSSSDPSTVTVFPTNMLIPQGATAPSRSPTITGVSNGSATITAVSYGMASVSGTVQVGTGGGGGTMTMSFSPTSLSFNSIGTQNLTLNLSSPAPSGGLTVTLSSSNTGVATAPANVTFGANAASVSVPVSATGSGSATITASASGVSNATAGVSVNIATAQPSINVSSSLTVQAGQSAAFPVTLSAPAPAGGVFVMLTSSDLSKATVTPSILISGGATAPASQPLVAGISAGSATITATASGYTAGSGTVQVQAAGGGGGGQTYFLPGNVNLNQGTTQTIELLLSTPSPVPLTATLTSSNNSIFTVPFTLSIPAGSGGVNLVVTAGSPGSATLTAVTPGYGTASVNVTVLPTNGVSVTWYGACWQTATIYGITGNFQAMDLAISTPAPVTLNATLFFAPNCDASQGSDNMNDFGSTMGSGHTVQGFSHFPDVMPVSAMYWIGPLTVDRKCPPGAPCSGCVNYTKTTPNCDILP